MVCAGVLLCHVLIQRMSSQVGGSEWFLPPGVMSRGPCRQWSGAQSSGHSRGSLMVGWPWGLATFLLGYNIGDLLL